MIEAIRGDDDGNAEAIEDDQVDRLMSEVLDLRGEILLLKSRYERLERLLGRGFKHPSDLEPARPSRRRR